MATKPQQEPAPVTAAATPLKICCYAQTTRRKTLQIAYLVDLVGAENVLVISAEEGLNTVASKLTVPANVIAVTSLSEFRAAFPAIRKFSEENSAGWVAIDGATQIADWVGNEQLANADRFYENYARGLPAPAGLEAYKRYVGRDGELNTMQIYGRIGRDMENMLGAWKTLPCNLYANFWEDMTVSNGFKAEPPYGPDVPGKVGLKAVIGAFDFVLRLTLNADGKLCAQTRSSPLALCKTREDQFAGVIVPPEIVDFRLDEFIALVKPQPAS